MRISRRPIAMAMVSTVVPLMALSGSPTVAQAAADSTASSDETRLEEIVITADRKDSYGADFVQAGSFRGARQIDTPLTISVVPEELIQAQQALSILDALRNTPGVTSSQTSPTVYNNLSIRGIPVENRGNYRLNGSLPIINLIDLPLEDKVRVEALKGASALYYGFTTPSGIINLTTKRPPAQPVLVVNVFGNEHGGLAGHVDAGNTWGKFGARVNLVAGDVASGIDKTDGSRDFESGAFQYDATDNLQFNLDLEHIHKKVTEPTVVQLAATATELPRLVDPATNPGADYFYADADEVNWLGRMSWDISPAWNLVAEVGQSHLKRDRLFTRLGNFNPVTGVGKLTLSGAEGQDYENTYYHTELATAFKTGPAVHELLIGASKNERTQYSPSAVGLTAANCVTIGLASNCNQNYYDPTPLLPLTGYSASVPYNPSRDTSIDDLGYYVFDRINFGGDRVSLLLGGRQSDYTERNVALGKTYSASPFSWSGGVVVKPMDRVSVYATYIEGLESTPAAPQTAVNSSEVLPPSESTQYEGGVKFELLEGMLLTASYFDIERQLTYLNSDNYFVKDGRANYKGFEFSATGEVNEDLSLYATALFLDATQGQTADVTLIGNRIENTPKQSYSLAGEYRLGGVANGFAVTAGIYYVGNRAINPANSLFLPSYTLFDLGASYRTTIGGREVTFRINGENITSERYFSSTGGNYIAVGPPSTIKFSVMAALF